MPENTKEERSEIELQTHESGIKFYIIPLYDKETQEKKILRVFQTYNAARLEFETRDEYYVRRKLNKEQEKKKKKGVMVWNSSAWGTLTPQKAMQLMEELNQNK